MCKCQMGGVSTLSRRCESGVVHLEGVGVRKLSENLSGEDVNKK